MSVCARRWLRIWQAVVSRAVPCSWLKDIRTSAGTPSKGSATSPSCDLRSSSTVRLLFIFFPIIVISIDHPVHEAVASPSSLDFPGESVEENSSVVVKLLIRRPECFGPALRGEGGNGLLAAMKEAIKISETPALDLPGSVHGVCSDVYA